MNTILRLEHIQKYYGNEGNLTKAIQDISFSVEAGEFLGIMGASGSGKTTLLNCISTIDTVSAGHIFLEGTDITEIRPKSLARFRRENLGFVFQDFNLLDTLTISENIALALAINKVPAGSVEPRVLDMAGKLNISDILNKYPYQVSGGQKQRCACARAMINNPKLLLADEPTGALDSHSSQMLLSTIQSINEQLETTILMVTHDAFSASYASRILFLKDGEIFMELRRGDDSRSAFFDKILNVLTMIGGGQSMYAKLVFRNAKRSVKDYLVYIVTMTICVALFYAFLSISSSYYNPDVGREYDFTLLSDGMKAAICMITFLLLFLIRFVNRYMLLRKQKEFALQSIMGMEQKTIGRMFFAETLIMGMLSIWIGIFLGVFCSQFITAMLLTAYGKPYEISWTLFPDTVLLTVVFFVASFFAVGIFNTRTIQKTKMIDMLSAEKENEPELKKSRFISIAAVFFELFAVWGLIAGIQKIWFYYDPRFALPVQLMFLGNVLFPLLALLWPVFCIIRKKKRESFLIGLLIGSVLNAFAAASVAAVKNKYYLPFDSGTLNQYLLLVLIDVLFFICALIYLASGLIAAWKEKSPEHRYHEEALFFFGQITSKLNTTTKTMTIICITLVLAIFMFVAAPVLTGWSSGYLDIRSMYDVQVYSRYNNVYEEENLPQDSYEIITDFLAEYKIDTDYDCTFHLYLPEKDDFHNRQKYDFPITAISLSDYNTIREMLGYEPISLGENEFTTQWKVIATGEERNRFLKEHASIRTDAGELTLSGQSYYEDAIGETVYNSYTDILYVFPDSICEKLLPVMKNRYIKTAENISYENAIELEKLFTAEYPEQAESGVMYGIRFRTLQTNSTIASNFVLQAAMIYGAVVLMIICLTVLSLQQLLDAGQYQYRFSVLRKLGVEEKHIGKLILAQLGVWFGLPILTAIMVAAVIITYFIQAVSAEISAYIGFDALLLQIGATMGVLVLLLICYFISTWMIFRHAVHP